MDKDLPQFLRTFALLAEGELAAQNWEPYAANPYPDGTTEAGLWSVGWRRGAVIAGVP